MNKSFWNYSNIISNNINNDISFNGILNKKFVGFCKIMNNFKQSLYDVINLYEMKDKYIEKKISITAFEHYIKKKF